MHEYGLAEGVLATVRQRADGRKVAGVRVRFGVRHAVDSESMSQAFSFVAEGTEAAGATVDLVTVPATITCRDCGLVAETSDVLATCPRCAGENVDITGGDEMTLESITYEPLPAPVESAPMESAPMESAPMESAPMESAPMESAPMESAPMESAERG
jgi:hydrogenase nickel incorporation protein HypA/HybF